VKRLLIVYHSHGWRTEALAQAAAEGARQAGAELDVRCERALSLGLEDFLAADAYLFATPETFGSLSGALKDFFERVFYPAQGKVSGRPYAIIVCAGEDGQGAIQSIQRIARGFPLREVQAPLRVHRDAVPDSLPLAAELGGTLGAGLLIGIY
jgi:multimeric flavodoxin WrbA